jgi:5-methylcytosine-specific restriction endonuclease McrA
MSLSAIVMALAEAGCSGEQIAAAVAAHEAEADAKKANERVRLKARRASNDVSDQEWYELRLAVFNRDSYRCTYCGSDGDGVALHCDHVIPRSRGGLSNLKNLTTSCFRCNCSKGDRTPAEWGR